MMKRLSNWGKLSCGLIFVLVLYIAMVTKTALERAYTAGTYVQHEAVCRDLKIYASKHDGRIPRTLSEAVDFEKWKAPVPIEYNPDAWESSQEVLLSTGKTWISSSVITYGDCQIISLED